MIRTILFISTFLMTISLNAQQFKEYVNAGDRAYQQNQYYEALTRYGDAMEMYEGSVEVTYRYAESARQFDAYKLAEKSYKTVLKSKDAANYPLAKFWLGTIQKQLGKYEKAKENFKQFLSSAPSENAKILDARKYIKDCEWSMTVLESRDESLEIKQLNQEVNTPYSDFGAVERGDTLYYSSDRFENESDEHTPNRHVSKVLTSVAGSKGLPIKNGFNKKRNHTAHTAFSTNGQKMYYTVCEYINTVDIRCDIYVRNKRSNDFWGDPKKLPEFINMPKYTQTQPNVGFDKATGKEILYFASDRVGSKGGMDIWYLTLNPDGSYGQPANLQGVNTEANDITPFFHNQEQVLYFSSKGYPTMGGYDVYKSTKNANNWEAPQHLGAPLNSSFNDIYYSVNADGTKAYFSSNRLGSAYIEKDKEACCNDIYSVELGAIIIDLMALTFDSLSMNELAGVEMRLEDATGQKVDGKYNPTENEFLFKLDPNQTYRLVATKDGYSTATRDLTVGDGKSAASRSLEEKLILAKLPEAPLAPLALEALVFDKADNGEIKGATVFLINKGNNKNQNKRNPASNDFNFDLERETPYLLIAQKRGYKSDTLEINPSSMVAISDISHKLFLEKNAAPPPVTKLTLDGYLPLPLYFDNDQPDSRTRRISTQKTYIESYNAYYARKPIFRSEYAKGLRGEERIQAESKIDAFFESEVRFGAEHLGNFSEQLLRYLQQGESVEIKIKGFASPRAQSDYNKSLTKRRISSLRNHFQRWKGGALIQYINNRQLKITEVSFGEDSATQGVSDDILDRKNSIYSVSASKERRVEILEIKAN